MLKTIQHFQKTQHGSLLRPLTGIFAAPEMASKHDNKLIRFYGIVFEMETAIIIYKVIKKQWKC